MELVSSYRNNKYKNTEVGLIPSDWDLKELGQIGAFSKGQGIKKDDAQSGEIPCVRYGELYTRHHDYIKQYYSFISPIIASSSKKLKVGDILFAGSGETKEEIGKCAAFIDEIVAYAGGDVVILSPSNVDSLYLAFLLNSPLAVKQKASRGQGDSVVHISAGSLKNVKIPFPPTKAEQTAIATALSDADALIQSLEKLIAKKRNIKQGAMQELLRPKKGWIIKKLGDVAEIDAHNLPGSTDPNYSFNYISLENVDAGRLRVFTEYHFANAPSRARRKVKKGDILISTVRPNLKAHLLVKEDLKNFICSTGFSVICCNPKEAISEYVFYHFFARSIETQIEALLSGSNYPSINGRDVKALTIPFPSILVQLEVSTILGDMNKEIESLENKLAKYKMIKQGMMQNLLTGKIRLV